MTDHQLTLETEAARHNVHLPGLRLARHLTIQERYEAWRATDDGALVYAEVRRRALALVARGWAHYSHKALIEAVRYARDFRVGPLGGFKVNDHMASRLARELMADEPRLACFFETRELRA